LFFDHFTGTNIEIKIRNENESKPFLAAKSELSKARAVYYQHSEALEKIKRTSLTSSNNINTISQQKHYETSEKIAQENYKKCIDEVNYIAGIYQSQMPDILESLQQNEESRIHFIKNSAERFIRHYQRLIEANNNCLVEFSDSVNFINSNFDIKNYTGRLSKPIHVQENFIDYETWKNLKTIDEVGDVEIVSSVIDYLLFNKSCKFADISKLNEILLSNKGKDMFLQGLENLRQHDKIEALHCQKLADIFKKILSNLDDDESSQIYFIKLLTLSHIFYTESHGHKHYLTDHLKSEKIWQSPKRWSNAIQLSISSKLQTDKELSQKSSQIKKRPSFILSTLKDLAHKIPLPTNKEKPIEKSEKSSAYNILSHFTNQMSNLAVPSKISQSIIMKIAEDYMLESDRVCSLLSQIQYEHGAGLQKTKKSHVEIVKVFRLVLDFLSPEEGLLLISLNKALL
jgi:hypothetical protein